MKHTFLLLLVGITLRAEQPTITVIGTGYVGLVLGACLAQGGHHVICADIEKSKIDLLNNNGMPLYEPGLREIIEKARACNRLTFTDQVIDAIKHSSLIFVAVGTPTRESGESDLSAIYAVVNMVIQNLNSDKILCIKSTVPVGTTNKLFQLIQTHPNNYSIELVFCPEFLREGAAVHDLLHPDRIVIGSPSSSSAAVIKQLYEQIGIRCPILITTPATAEMIKYAANSLLATKISFINEIAQLCEKVDADVAMVSQGIGLDHRIGKYFLSPGPGFGGSCFPKDIQALLYLAKQHNVDLRIVKGCLEANEAQKQHIIQKIVKHCGGLVAGKKITILGLAFKAHTDDIRYSPAIPIIEYLSHHGAHVTAYDPQAMHHMAKMFPDVEYCETMELAIHQADMVVILTEWPEFKQLKVSKRDDHTPIIIDTRNMINTRYFKDMNIRYENIGNARVS